MTACWAARVASITRDAVEPPLHHRLTPTLAGCSHRPHSPGSPALLSTSCCGTSPSSRLCHARRSARLRSMASACPRFEPPHAFTHLPIIHPSTHAQTCTKCLLSLLTSGSHSVNAGAVCCVPRGCQQPALPDATYLSQINTPPLPPCPSDALLSQDYSLHLHISHVTHSLACTGGASGPEYFDPDRWLRPGEMDSRAFMPFGGGPRMCPGYPLAKMELTVRLQPGWACAESCLDVLQCNAIHVPLCPPFTRRSLRTHKRTPPPTRLHPTHSIHLLGPTLKIERSCWRSWRAATSGRQQAAPPWSGPWSPSCGPPATGCTWTLGSATSRNDQVGSCDQSIHVYCLWNFYNLLTHFKLT